MSLSFLRRTSTLAAIVGILLGAGVIVAMPARVLFPRHVESDTGVEPGVRWACAMMDYVSQTRGNGICPVCGMTLQRITAGALTAEQRRRMGVETTTITMGPARVTVRAYGAARYDSRFENAIIARVSGRIVKRHPAALHAGQDVAVGDPLYDLYSPQAISAQAELAAAMASRDQKLIDAMMQRFERWNLRPIGEAILAGKPPVDSVTITSPFSGRVIMAEAMPGSERREMPETGSEVRPDQTLMTLVDPERFMLVVHVPEAQARLLAVGQPVAIASDDGGDLTGLAATLDWIAPELNSDIRAREVHIHLHDVQRQVFAGSLVSARISSVLGPLLTPADPQDQTTWGRFALVPKSAVLSTGVRQVVWRRSRVDGDQHHYQPVGVALGPRLEDADGNDRYVVRAGLAEGDVVATQGAFLLDSQAQLVGSTSLLFPDGAVPTSPTHQH